MFPPYRCGADDGLFFCPAKFWNTINQKAENRKVSLILKIAIPSTPTSHIDGTTSLEMLYACYIELHVYYVLDTLVNISYMSLVA